MQEFEAKESSNIKWARWYPDEERLEVDFRNQITGAFTSTYTYQNFSSMDWEAFQAAESKGKYFAAAIRYAKNADSSLKYPYTRLK